MYVIAPRYPSTLQHVGVVAIGDEGQSCTVTALPRLENDEIVRDAHLIDTSKLEKDTV